MEMNEWVQEETQKHERLVNRSSVSGNSGFNDSNSTKPGSNEKELMLRKANDLKVLRSKHQTLLLS